MKLTILMPSLNEEDSVGRTIASIPVAKLKAMGLETEVIIVDGGSADKTVAMVMATGAKVIETHKGYGHQYRTGFSAAAGEIIGTADSDFSYPMEEIPRLINILLSEDLDFISTNRFAFMEKDSMAALNKFGNRFLTFITNLLFDFKLKDSQSGMWVIKRKILEEIQLKGNGMSLSQEIKIRAFSRFRAKEVDSSYRKRVGKVKLRIFLDGFDNLFWLFKLKFSR